MLKKIILPANEKFVYEKLVWAMTMCAAEFHIESSKIFGFNLHHIKNAVSGQLALRHNQKRSQNSFNPQMIICKSCQRTYMYISHRGMSFQLSYSKVKYFSLICIIFIKPDGTALRHT